MSEETKNQPAPQNAALAHLFATVDKNVADLRAGDISGRDVRDLSRQRRVNERKTWGDLSGAARTRGAR